jgi:glutamate decarboxylase
VTGFSVFDVSERLRGRGWQVPAYTLPEDLTDTAVLRIVVRNGFSRDLAGLFLDELQRQVRILDTHPHPHAPLVAPRTREAFTH